MCSAKNNRYNTRRRSRILNPNVGISYEPDTDTTDDESSNGATVITINATALQKKDEYPFEFTYDKTNKDKVIFNKNLTMLDFEYIAQCYRDMVQCLEDSYCEAQWKAVQEMLRTDVICAVYTEMANIHKLHVVDLYNQLYSTDKEWQMQNLKNHTDLANDMMDLANLDI